jgi:hypothetical protein
MSAGGALVEASADNIGPTCVQKNIWPDWHNLVYLAECIDRCQFRGDVQSTGPLQRVFIASFAAYMDGQPQTNKAGVAGFVLEQ